jgi:predicted phage tail protein
LPLPFTIGGEPGVPSNVQVLVGQTLRVAWSPPSTGATPTGYRLDIRTGAAIVASITVGTTTTFETPIPPGIAGAFTVTVTALNGAMAGASSSPTAFTIGAPPRPPTNLLGLANGTLLALSWTNPTTGPASSGLRLDVTGSLSTSLVLPAGESFTFAGVPPGTYAFTLTAFNQSGASPPSTPVTLTFPAPCTGTPQEPLAFTAARNGRTISVSWDAPVSGPAVTGYVLLVEGALSATLSTQGRSLTGAVGPGTYTLRVAATNPCGTGASTLPVTIDVP